MKQVTQSQQDRLTKTASSNRIDELTEKLKERSRRLHLDHQVDYLVSRRFPKLFVDVGGIGILIVRDFSKDLSLPDIAKQANEYMQELLEIAEEKPHVINSIYKQHRDAMSLVRDQAKATRRAEWKLLSSNSRQLGATLPSLGRTAESGPFLRAPSIAKPTRSYQSRKATATGVRWPEKADTLSLELVPIIEEMLSTGELVLPRTVWQKLKTIAQPGQTIFGFTGEMVQWLNRHGEPQELSFRALNERLKTILTYG